MPPLQALPQALPQVLLQLLRGHPDLLLGHLLLGLPLLGHRQLLDRHRLLGLLLHHHRRVVERQWLLVLPVVRVLLLGHGCRELLLLLHGLVRGRLHRRQLVLSVVLLDLLLVHHELQVLERQLVQALAPAPAPPALPQALRPPRQQVPEACRRHLHLHAPHRRDHGLEQHLHVRALVLRQRPQLEQQLPLHRDHHEQLEAILVLHDHVGQRVWRLVEVVPSQLAVRSVLQSERLERLLERLLVRLLVHRGLCQLVILGHRQARSVPQLPHLGLGLPHQRHRRVLLRVLLMPLAVYEARQLATRRPSARDRTPSVSVVPSFQELFPTVIRHAPE